LLSAASWGHQGSLKCIAIESMSLPLFHYWSSSSLPCTQGFFQSDLSSFVITRAASPRWVPPNHPRRARAPLPRRVTQITWPIAPQSGTMRLRFFPIAIQPFRQCRWLEHQVREYPARRDQGMLVFHQNVESASRNFLIRRRRTASAACQARVHSGADINVSPPKSQKG
jgi:hypothetical protein